MQVVCALKELAKGGHTEFYFFIFLFLLFFFVKFCIKNAGSVRAEGARERRAHVIFF
jgi:hypothetical protein